MENNNLSNDNQNQILRKNIIKITLKSHQFHVFLKTKIHLNKKSHHTKQAEKGLSRTVKFKRNFATKHRFETVDFFLVFAKKRILRVFIDLRFVLDVLRAVCISKITQEK